MIETIPKIGKALKKFAANELLNYKRKCEKNYVTKGVYRSRYQGDCSIRESFSLFFGGYSVVYDIGSF